MVDEMTANQLFERLQLVTTGVESLKRDIYTDDKEELLEEVQKLQRVIDTIEQLLEDSQDA